MNVAGGAVLDLASFDQTIGSLAGGGNVLLGAAALTTGGDGTNTLLRCRRPALACSTKTGDGVVHRSRAATATAGARRSTPARCW